MILLQFKKYEGNKSDEIFGAAYVEQFLMCLLEGKDEYYMYVYPTIQFTVPIGTKLIVKYMPNLDDSGRINFIKATENTWKKEKGLNY